MKTILANAAKKLVTTVRVGVGCCKFGRIDVLPYTFLSQNR